MEYHIQKPTACHVGRHVWIYASASTNTDTQPAPFHRCDCGMYKWEDAYRINEIVRPKQPPDSTNIET